MHVTLVGRVPARSHISHGEACYTHAHTKKDYHSYNFNYQVCYLNLLGKFTSWTKNKYLKNNFKCAQKLPIKPHNITTLYIYIYRIFCVITHASQIYGPRKITLTDYPHQKITCTSTMPLQCYCGFEMTR